MNPTDTGRKMVPPAKFVTGRIIGNATESIADPTAAPTDTVPSDLAGRIEFAWPLVNAPQRAKLIEEVAALERELADCRAELEEAKKRPDFELDCLAGKLTTWEAICGYVSRLEIEARSQPAPSTASGLADRLEAMLHQVGHPDYSLKEFYEGLKLIVWEFRSHQAPVGEERDSVIEECARVCEREQQKYSNHGLESAACRGALEYAIEGLRALKTPSPQTGGGS